MNGIYKFLHQDVLISNPASPYHFTRGILVRATRNHYYLEETQVGFMQPGSGDNGEAKQYYTGVMEYGGTCVPRNSRSILLTKNFTACDFDPIGGAHLLDRELVKRRARVKIQEIRDRNKPSFIRSRYEKMRQVFPEFLLLVGMVGGAIYFFAL